MTTEIPPERAPLVGEQATRVELPHDANVEITHSKRAAEINEFDLDIRFGAGIRFASVGYASSGPDECYKAAEDTDGPCGHTCDAFLCKTFIGPGGGRARAAVRGRRARMGAGPTPATPAIPTAAPATPSTARPNAAPATPRSATRTAARVTPTSGQTNCGGCERRRRR